MSDFFYLAGSACFATGTLRTSRYFYLAGSALLATGTLLHMFL